MRTSLLVLFLALAGCAGAPPVSTRLPHTSSSGQAAVAIVRVHAPWYAPRFVIRGKFHDVLGEYEGLTALQAKYFTITDGCEFGGIYLWSSRADIEKHFDAAWHARVKEKRGVDGDVLVMDAPFVIDGPALPRGKRAGPRTVDFPAWASFVRWPLAEGSDPAAAAQALSARTAPPAMIRAFVVTEPHSVGLVTLWATRDAAEGAVKDASATEGVLFEAPLLIDATLATP